MPARRPTQADVARLAGVSRSTVSIVLNGSDGGRIRISPGTRQRVLDSLRKLGYAPNAAAQMLARGRNQLIGVFTYEPYFPYEAEDFYYPFLLGIEREASRQGYNLLLVTRNRIAGRYSIYQDGTNSLSLADGAILLGPHPDRAELCRLAAEGYPFVYIGRREVPGCAIDWVASDYTAASRVATRHLLDLGHRRLALAARDANTEAYVDKRAGCVQAIDGVSDAVLWELSPDGLTTPDQLRDELGGHGVTALICADSATLQTVGPFLRALSIRIPEELSLVLLTDGQADLLPGVRLTEVRLNRPIVGETAVRLLIDRLNGTAAGPQHARVPCDFVVGDTTGPPGGPSSYCRDRHPKTSPRDGSIARDPRSRGEGGDRSGSRRS